MALMRMLTVEDERDMAEVLKEGLEEENYFVSLAFDACKSLCSVLKAIEQGHLRRASKCRENRTGAGPPAPVLRC